MTYSFGSPLENFKKAVDVFSSSIRTNSGLPDFGRNFSNFSGALSEIGATVSGELKSIFTDSIYQYFYIKGESFFQKGLDFFTKGFSSVSGFVQRLVDDPVRTMRESWLYIEQGFRRMFDSFLRKQPRREVEDIGQEKEVAKQQASLISAASFFNSVQGARMTAGERAIIRQLQENDRNAAERQRAVVDKAEKNRDEDKGILFQAGVLLGNAAGFDFGG